MSTVVGVDVGGTNVRAIAQRRDGSRSAVVAEPVPGTLTGLVDAIGRLVATVAPEGPAGCAVGLPGHTSPSRVTWVPNLRYLDSAPLAQLVGERCGARCLLVNDAQATLVAEQAEGAARGRRDALLVTVGTGIGGAVLAGGRLMRGAHGCAGSFGWLPAERPASDADHGPWETVASGTALRRDGQRWGGAEAVVAAARSGDGEAADVVADFARRLGVGTAGLASILDPEVIVLAGGLSDAFDLLAEPLMAAHRACASPAGRGVEVVRARLGPAAGVIGPALIALTPEVLS